MSGRRHLEAIAALSVLALSGCVPTTPDVIVRTQTLVCPASPPEPLPCPAVVEGDTLGATIETLRERGECLAGRVETWETLYASCATD